MSDRLRGNILVTGGNRGLGLELVKQLAVGTAPDAHIYASCRVPEGAEAEVGHSLGIPDIAAAPIHSVGAGEVGKAFNDPQHCDLERFFACVVVWVKQVFSPP